LNAKELNAKEFAVAAGISYTSAREWFRQPGFPAINGFVFWGDFVHWRRVQTGIVESKSTPPQASKPNASESPSKAEAKFPARASRVLIEAG